MASTTAKVHLSCIICMVYVHYHDYIISGLWVYVHTIFNLVGIPFKHIRCVVLIYIARWLLRGSAGANCWFDAGHSDSMDPMTFRRSARRVFGGHGRGFREGLGWLNVYFLGGGVWGCLLLVCLGEDRS